MTHFLYCNFPTSYHFAASFTIVLLIQLHYITPYPGGGTASLSLASSVYGYIGSAPTYRRLSRWGNPSCHHLQVKVPMVRRPPLGGQSLYLMHVIAVSFG